MKKEKDIIQKFRSDPTVKEKFIEGIKQSGLLLEHEVETKLFKKGFSCAESLYLDKSPEGDISRQIDIYALKFYKTIKVLDRFAIFPLLVLVGDCKYSSNEGACLINVNLPSRNLSKTSINFPYFVNGDCFFEYFPKGPQGGEFFSIFKGCFICHKVENFNYYNYKGEKGVSEKNIYQICESQLMPALAYYYKASLSELMEQYNLIGKKANEFFVYDKKEGVIIYL